MDDISEEDIDLVQQNLGVKIKVKIYHLNINFYRNFLSMLAQTWSNYP